jgi:hypothetical protein
MLAILLAVTLAAAPAPACVGDGHNHHRSKSAVKRFQKAWARAHGGLPCPEECALYRFVDGTFVLYQRCGGCQVVRMRQTTCSGLRPRRTEPRATTALRVRGRAGEPARARRGYTCVIVSGFPRGALEAAAAQVAPGWRCAICGCDAVQAGRRGLRRGRALPRNAVT